MLLLYKLGVIGLYFDKKVAENNGYGSQLCFTFNEGMDPIDDFISVERSNTPTQIIFNPIFAKYLSLNYNTTELICDYSWEYITTNHSLKDNIRRI